MSYSPLEADHPVARSRCPGCGHEVDRAGGMQDAEPPTPGAISICISCGYLSIFTEDLALRPPTEAELAEIRADTTAWPIIQRARQNVARLSSFKREEQ